MKINVTQNKLHDRLPWLAAIAEEFMIEHDIKVSNTVWAWLKTRDGIRYFGEWLKEKGWEVTYWELPPFVDPSKNGVIKYLGFGLDFKNDCPKFIEAKLKNS